MDSNEDLKAYIRNKIRLIKDFDIKLSFDEKKHIKSLKNEIQVDNYAHDLIRKTNMHCWFSIIEDSRGSYCVFDMENNRRLSLKSGIKQFFQGLTGEDVRNLSVTEKGVCFDVMLRLLDNQDNIVYGS